MEKCINGKPLSLKKKVILHLMNPCSMQPGNIGKGVKVTEIVEDPSEGNKVYDPSHPDADEDGYATYPNVNTVTEMTNMIDATRAYEA